jgi:hypothetical protein
MNALDYYFDDATCIAETLEELNELLTLKMIEIPTE